MDLSKYPTVKLLNHPLLEHKISKLRDVTTDTNNFRQLVKEIAVIEGYEALRNLPTKQKEITTPIEKTSAPFIEPKSLCFVPILRAGLGMVDGLLELVPGAHVGHIGLYRDEATAKPVTYYCKLPEDIERQQVYILDPMLATAGSATAAVEILKEHGVSKIAGFLCIIAAPEGVKNFVKECPDIPLYVGAIDRELNDKYYICPGLGDCGDRIFGTLADPSKLNRK